MSASFRWADTPEYRRPMNSVDRTFSIGERAVDLMRSYSRSATPRSYEVWFTYVTGLKPQLNDALKRLVALRDKLTEDEIDSLHETYLQTEKLAAQANRVGTGMVVEIEQVMGIVDLALGSTARYGESLQAISDDLSRPVERNGLRDILESLVIATRDVASTNRCLETRLKDSRTEIENLRQALEAVRLETLIDPLTQLANRKHFESTLMTLVESARADLAPLSLIVIDIDNFKRFNDVYGHLTGDQVLRLVGAAMRENVDDGATLARFGGEEFGIILPCATTNDAFTCAEKIRQNVMGRELLKRSTGESLGRVTISIGIAGLTARDSATSLLERADLCMYAAKQMGRNRTVTDHDAPEARVAPAA